MVPRRDYIVLVDGPEEQAGPVPAAVIVNVFLLVVTRDEGAVSWAVKMRNVSHFAANPARAISALEALFVLTTPEADRDEYDDGRDIRRYAQEHKSPENEQ